MKALSGLTDIWLASAALFVPPGCFLGSGLEYKATMNGAASNNLLLLLEWVERD